MSLFSCHQTDVAAVQEVKINHSQRFDIAVFEGLANDCHIQFLHGLCLFRQLHELLCPEYHQRILVVQLFLPVFQEVLSVLQHGVPGHHKGFVQVCFQERIVDAPFDFLALALAGAHPSLNAAIQSVEGAPPEKLTTDTAEYPVGEGLLVRTLLSLNSISLARGFMLRKPVDRRREERDSSGRPSGNIDLSSCGIYKEVGSNFTGERNVSVK